MDIVNRGFAGYNSDQGALILPEVFKLDSSYEIMTIFLGTNDSFDTFQNVPLERYSKNLDEMVKLAKSKGIKVIVISPAIHDTLLFEKSEVMALTKKLIGSNEKNEQYMKAAQKVAQSNDVGFVDLFTAFKSSSYPPSELLTDGIHYKPQAYAIVFEELMKEIGSRFPELSPDSLPLSLCSFYELADATGDPPKMKEIMFGSSKI